MVILTGQVLLVVNRKIMDTRGFTGVILGQSLDPGGVIIAGIIITYSDMNRISKPGLSRSASKLALMRENRRDKMRVTKHSRTINMADYNPELYVSTSKGKWRVIYHGMPLCRDANTVDEVIPVYEKARVQAHLPDLQDIPLWDGDYGTFRAW